MRSLSIPSGVISIDDDATAEDAAEQVMYLLIDGEPWVQIWYQDRPDLITRWTVLSRDANGVPMQIGSQEFDGTVEIINNDPQYEEN